MQDKDQNISLLTELNEELENYFQNTIIPQLFVDSQMVLRKFTPPAMKQFNLGKQHIGKHLDEIADNFRFPTIIDNIQHVVDTGEILEKEIQTTDMKWRQMNIIPYIVRRDKRTNGVIITFVDITSRIKDLKEQEKLIAEHELLLDTIAHDIKNPLFALSVAIDMLGKMPDKGFARFPAIVENVDSSLNKMKVIISDLLDSRWGKHRYQAAEEILDLQNILEDVRLTLSSQISETDAVISLKLSASEITFPRRKLRSIIYNLVNNALKYSAPDRRPEISIESHTEPGYVVISVTDNGIGIDSSHHASIFEKFNRIESAEEGSGVGLYLVNEILKACGGDIAVESELGGGSTFRVYLPSGETK